MRMHRLGVFVAIGLLAACGGGDDEASDNAAGAEAASAGADGESVGLDDASAADGVEISGLDEIPEECRQILVGFLQEVEPVVSDVDWQTATMSDLSAVGAAIEGPSAEVDVDMEEAGCNEMNFVGGEDAGFVMSLELAQSEAPGAVSWLEFVRNVSDGFDGAEPVAELAGDPEDDPETCDEALTAVRDLMSVSDTMTALPVDELLTAGTNLQAIPAVCSFEEMDVLFDDPDFQAWSES